MRLCPSGQGTVTHFWLGLCPEFGIEAGVAMVEPGQQVGGFRLVRELGSGGFGSVYLGKNASGQHAAVKLLHPHLAADLQVRRYFSQELINARRVQGFCLAAIVDADPGADRPWIATEYVQGPTLAQAVRQHGPRLGGDLQRLAVQTITALSAIHTAGVVHRDLKPANILLGPDGPRVIDFGIARALDADTSSATRIGTPGYMAPEQIEGTALGPAADLFAWGAVIIHAATGSAAFPGATQAARINQVLTQPPQTGDLADPLLTIVLACMAKDPEQRPTARQVLDMLLSGRTTPSPSEIPTASEDDKEGRLRRAAEVGDVEAMKDLGLLMRQRGKKNRAESWYRRAAEAGDTEAMNSLGLMLQQRKDLSQAESWFRRGAEAGDTGAMFYFGRLLAERGETAQAEAWYRCAAEVGQIDSMYKLGTLLQARASTDEAAVWYRRAADGGNSDAMNRLGVLLHLSGETVEAETWYRRAASAEIRSYFAMDNLANLLAERGEHEEAEVWRRRADEPPF
ncbi:protein kinase [Nocardiopsis dassonvillei]|uniref:serine/threonine-protein kinase n=1 Tax=Nocardiopsis dassonvillei TaxID=2014 RepID=UPI0033C39768